MSKHFNESSEAAEPTRRFNIGEMMDKIYKDTPQPEHLGRTKSLGEYIKFTNEGKLTRAEQLKRDRRLCEATGLHLAPEEDLSQSTHGEVVGVLSDLPDPKMRKKGLEVSFINGQIVLDRSTLNRQVDHFDMIDSDEDILKGVVDHNAKRRHKVVVWSVEETRQFYECLRRYGTDFFMMNKVLTKRSRRELKNKYKTEEKRNPRLVSLSLAVHLKESVQVPDVVPEVPHDGDEDEDEDEDLGGDLEIQEMSSSQQQLETMGNSTTQRTHTSLNDLSSTREQADLLSSEKGGERIGTGVDSDVEDDDDDMDIAGALSESSSESSDDGILLRDLM